MAQPQFPLYIVSKGRWDSRLTARALESMGTPYRMVVEEQEFENYAAVIDPAKLLILDPEFKKNYDTFSELGAEKGTGSGPARNFAGEHSRAEGHAWHWVMDDNIQSFHRLHKNLKVPVGDGTCFRVMEDFVLRYRNIAMAGPNYFMFAVRKQTMPPLVLNTRIYSCNLIRNDLPFRWRGRYNEDTDLSLRMLKAGWVTVLFNAMLQYKMPTQTIKGGNTDTIYVGGTRDKSQMLVDMHPDVARLAHRFKRDHHIVDYSGFKQQPVLRPGVTIAPGADNYGMELFQDEAFRKSAIKKAAKAAGG